MSRRVPITHGRKAFGLIMAEKDAFAQCSKQLYRHVLVVGKGNKNTKDDVFKKRSK